MVSDEKPSGRWIAQCDKRHEVKPSIGNDDEICSALQLAGRIDQKPVQPLGNGAVRFAGCTEQGLLKSGDQGFKV